MKKALSLYELNQSYDYAISSILRELKYVTPETRENMINATKQLFANPHMRNGVVDTIIKSCIEKDAQGYEKFNQQVFEKVFILDIFGKFIYILNT